LSIYVPAFCFPRWLNSSRRTTPDRSNSGSQLIKNGWGDDEQPPNGAASSLCGLRVSIGNTFRLCPEACRNCRFEDEIATVSAGSSKIELLCDDPSYVGAVSYSGS
jgi:hypothetical protein